VRVGEMDLHVSCESGLGKRFYRHTASLPGETQNTREHIQLLIAWMFDACVIMAGVDDAVRRRMNGFPFLI
jgi:hypothetical protein